MKQQVIECLQLECCSIVNQNLSTFLQKNPLYSSTVFIESNSVYYLNTIHLLQLL